MSQNDQNIDLEQCSVSGKAIQLFTYLKELCALRSAQVRDVDSYDQVFWLRDLPRHKLCRSAIWQHVDSTDQIAEKNNDIWIEIRKPLLKSHPELPDDVEPWVNDDEITDSSLSEPSLFESISRVALQNDQEDEGSDGSVLINDYPRVFDNWVNYLESQWKPWAMEDRELQKVQKVYNQLFNIYQRQEKLGEQYEVVMGAGLLTWKSPKSGEIKRHVLAIEARIEFDRVRGVISVGPTFDGQPPVIECGMLETSDRPNPSDLTEIEKDVVSLDGDPWERAHLEAVLKGFVNSLSFAGDYVSTLEKSGALSERPNIKLAPALILRKRTRRTFEDFYRQIIEQISKGETVPENVRRIVEIVEDDGNPDELGRDIAAQNVISSESDDTEIYFPLPANDEQRRIVQKIECRRGILVQGPPGTGKSHTIANLIAHFLAKGKRILVTSETPRALDVLRNKLPREIEELCVVWLGTGPDSQKALEKSVLGITQRKANWDAVSEQTLMDEASFRLSEARKDQARLRHDMRTCRESDVYQHSNVYGQYSGTLQNIAMQIDRDRARFNWFIDRLCDQVVLSIKNEELLKMVQIHRTITSDIVDQLKFRLFPVEQLVPIHELRRHITAELRAQIAHNDSSDKRSYSGYSQLLVIGSVKRGAISSMIEAVISTRETLSKHFYSWVDRASREIAGGQDRVWRSILSSTIDHVDHVEKILAEHGKILVEGLDGKDLRLVKDHAAALKKHFDEGNGAGFWCFRARAVKEALYLIKSVKVNGKPCGDVQMLRQLDAWIEMSSRMTSLHGMWAGITPQPVGDEVLQCSVFRDLCDPIKPALVLHAQIEAIKEALCDYPGIRFPAWHSDEDVRAFGKAFEAAEVEENYTAAQRVFAPLIVLLQNHINSGGNHPVTAQLLSAVTQRDIDLYQKSYETMTSLRDWANSYNFARDIRGRFQNCCPQLCEKYDESYDDLVWDAHFSEFDKAWVWAKTECWLDEMNDKGRVKKIQFALDAAILQERAALKNLAASKAWQHCMSNLREKERMALIAWSQAVAKIRSGKGKYAETHRETARQKLDECRRAIPAWVMPLYQVVQTTRPGSCQFDVVIIDEASQSGPEALLLNYIADKLIVVGDDKQITPMHVGVDLSDVQFLSRKYLEGIPHSDALGLEGNLFSQAELRFPDRIRLREHFRCMPEIIQFSNNLSYSTEPLIPLRQYGADRLEPVRTIFVKEGYRKGSSDDLENPPEADAIVAQIAECCENPMYAGKTFGVICLKGGNRQTDRISSMLVKEIGAVEMEKRQLVCGRPYDFQGDERDVIFLGLVDALSDGMIRSDTSNPDIQRRYNVAMSRAKDQLWLFHSMTLNDLKPGSYQYRLLEYCLNPSVKPQTLPFDIMEFDKQRKDVKPPDPFDSWFEVDVFTHIHKRGFRVLPQFNVANYRIDLVVEGLKGRLAVECDGDEWHGPDRFESDMSRQRDLERCGWVFWRVRGSDFYRNSTVALQELWEALDRQKISPSCDWASDKKTLEACEIEAGSKSVVVVDESESSQIDVIAENEEQDYPIVEGTNERIVRALEMSSHQRQHAEELPPLVIQNAIAQCLRKCPNRTCTVKSLTSRVLKELGILTRGNPRLEFEKRVMRNLDALKNKGHLEEYKSRNKRIRLLREDEQPVFL